MHTAHALAPLSAHPSKKKPSMSKGGRGGGLGQPSRSLSRAYQTNPSDSWGGIALLTLSAAAGNLLTDWAGAKWQAYEDQKAADAGQTNVQPSVVGYFLAKGLVILAGFGLAAYLDKKHKMAASIAAGFGVGAAVGTATQGVKLLMQTLYTAPAATAAPAGAAPQAAASY